MTMAANFGSSDAGQNWRCSAHATERLPPDRDDALRAAWVAAAWPGMSAAARAELVREIKKVEPAR